MTATEPFLVRYFCSCISDSTSCFSSRLSCLVSAQTTPRLSPRQRCMCVPTLSFIFNFFIVLTFASVFISFFDLFPAIDSVFFLHCFFHLLPLSLSPPASPHLPPLLFPFPLLSLSLSVNENVLTRKKDLLGIAQFIRKAEVWKKKRRRALQRSPILVVVNV